MSTACGQRNHVVEVKFLRSNLALAYVADHAIPSPNAIEVHLSDFNIRLASPPPADVDQIARSLLFRVAQVPSLLLATFSRVVVFGILLPASLVRLSALPSVVFRVSLVTTRSAFAHLLFLFLSERTPISARLCGDSFLVFGVIPEIPRALLNSLACRIHRSTFCH